MAMRIASVLTLTALVWGTSLPAVASGKGDQDDTWVNIEGSVVEAGSEGFLLDYGYGRVRVHMSQLDGYGEKFELKEGDEVNITGKLDANFHQSKRLQASSLYVSRLGAYFYKADRGTGGGGEWAVDPDVGKGDLTLVGTVRSVNHAAGRFVIDADGKELIVDVSSISHDPLDEEGYRQVEQGDRVRVEGKIDERFMDEGQLKAGKITRLES